MTLSHPTPFECQMKTSLLSPLSKGWEPFWGNQVHHGLPPLTKIRIASLAELPTAPKAEIKGLLICLPQLVATLGGCKCLLSIAVNDEAIVVTLDTEMDGALLNLSENREPLFPTLNESCGQVSSQ